MSRTKTARKKSLAGRYPESEPCACETCVGYCARPGWWTVEEAARAVEAGYGERMMLEMSPARTFGVLSPAFKGNERAFALDLYAASGCTFLANGLCELHGTGLEPLECRHCHHDRPGAGPRCHDDIAHDWNSPTGRALVVTWSKRFGLWDQWVTARGPGTG